MSGWLIYDECDYKKNKWFAQEIVSALDCRLIIADELEYGVDNGLYFKYCGSRLYRPDFVVRRNRSTLLAQALEWYGVRVFNNSAVCDICNDKRKTHALAATMDIPMLKTVFGKGDMPYPHIVKEVGGHGGTAVFMVNNDKEKAEIDGEILCQECARDLGIDKRVYILGKEAYIGIKRTAVDGFKSNFSLGGNVEVSTIGDDERQIAYSVAKALNSDFIGVDFVYSDGKPYLNEVEDVVGTRMIYQTTTLDPVKAYAKYIKDELKK